MLKIADLTANAKLTMTPDLERLLGLLAEVKELLASLEVNVMITTETGVPSQA